MSVITSTEEVPAVPATTREVRKYKCDLCGKESRRSAEWNNEQWKHDEVAISSTHHTHYPEGGGVTGEAFDCCPECFRGKVRPTLIELGLVPREVEIDW